MSITDATRSRNTKENLWRQRIRGWQASGSSQVDYCRQHGLKLATFQYWRRRLKDSSKASRLRLVPIQEEGRQPAPVQAIRVTVAGVVLEANSDLDPRILAGFVSALRR